MLKDFLYLTLVSILQNEASRQVDTRQTNSAVVERREDRCGTALVRRNRRNHYKVVPEYNRDVASPLEALLAATSRSPSVCYLFRKILVRVRNTMLGLCIRQDITRMRISLYKIAEKCSIKRIWF